jgi:hypothetical protein
MHQAAAISILVFSASILKERAFEVLSVTVNNIVTCEPLFRSLAEKLLLQIIYCCNKYSFTKFESLEYRYLIRCIEIISSTIFELKVGVELSDAYLLGQVVLLCNHGDVSSAISEASKLNLETTSDDQIFLTLAHHMLYPDLMQPLHSVQLTR